MALAFYQHTRCDRYRLASLDAIESPLERPLMATDPSHIFSVAQRAMLSTAHTHHHEFALLVDRRAITFITSLLLPSPLFPKPVAYDHRLLDHEHTSPDRPVAQGREGVEAEAADVPCCCNQPRSCPYDDETREPAVDRNGHTVYAESQRQCRELRATTQHHFGPQMSPVRALPYRETRVISQSVL